jgi:anti-sigma regulatory factor (Ser/Thr protein kinase)
VRVRSDADLSRAIVEAGRVARSAGLGALETNKFATAVSELGRNILKYAGSGEILLAEVTSRHRVGVEAKAVDRGPGIPNVEHALRDHVSSGGTLGLGLPGVRRMMDEFEIDSDPERGTTVCVRLFGAARSPPEAHPSDGAGSRLISSRLTGRGHGGVLPDDRLVDRQDIQCAYFTRPCLGERVNGDAVFMDRRGDVVFLGLIDALGHGEAAHRAATAARRHLRTSWTEDLVATIQGLSESLRGTVGAAAGLAAVEVGTRRLRFVAVGNVILRPMGRRDITFQYIEGTLGAQFRTPREQAMRMEPGEVVLMFTDGVSERLREEDYPQLRYERVQTVARTIVKRFGKAHDDATCIALRCPS